MSGIRHTAFAVAAALILPALAHSPSAVAQEPPSKALEQAATLFALLDVLDATKPENSSPGLYKLAQCKSGSKSMSVLTRQVVDSPWTAKTFTLQSTTSTDCVYSVDGALGVIILNASLLTNGVMVEGATTEGDASIGYLRNGSSGDPLEVVGAYLVNSSGIEASGGIDASVDLRRDTYSSAIRREDRYLGTLSGSYHTQSSDGSSSNQFKIKFGNTSTGAAFALAREAQTLSVDGAYKFKLTTAQGATHCDGSTVTVKTLAPLLLATEGDAPYLGGRLSVNTSDSAVEVEVLADNSVVATAAGVPQVMTYADFIQLGQGCLDLALPTSLLMTH